MFLTIEVVREDKQFKARCSEFDIEAKGTTYNEALAKLKKVIDFYIKTAKETSDFPSSCLSNHEPDDKEPAFN